MKPIDKILGADVELGNVVQRDEELSPRRETAGSYNDRAARLLLAEIDGVPSTRPTASASRVGSALATWYGGGRYSWPAPASSSAATSSTDYDPQDWGRKFLTGNGGCAYIDLNHLELCIPEVRSARDFVAYHQTNLALARDAQAAANARLDAGERLVVMANNSDRQGNSWGGHLNVLITRELWRRLFDRMYPDLFALAGFQCSSILYTGQGKVGSENGRPWVPYQLTQRGDFFECLEGTQTTYRRPIVNTRDEAHCGPGDHGGELARLHVIFHDTTLSDTSNLLKAGVTQLVLALMETGFTGRDTMLEHPLDALHAWGHDPDLHATAALADGRTLRAIDHQRLFLAEVQRFVERGDAECVPDAAAIVALWQDTLDRLERNDTAVLMRRLDWVLKRELLARMIERHASLHWDSPAVRAADLRFAQLDDEGLFRAIEAAGGTDALVSAEDVDHARHMPPTDTRAWSRTMLLRQQRCCVESVNWDAVHLSPATAGALPRVVRLTDPRRHGRADARRRAQSPEAAEALPAGRLH